MPLVGEIAILKRINQIIVPLLTFALALTGALVQQSSVEAATQVNLALTPASQTVNTGETFEVAIQALSGTQELVGVDVYLDFDPAKLAVVDMDPGTTGIQISGGVVLSMPLRNMVDNSTGHIDYSAGSLNPYPNGSLTIATIRFRVLAATSAATAITFSTSLDRPTLVVGDTQGTNVTGSLTGGMYSFSPGITPTPQPNGGEGGGGGSPQSKTVNTNGLSTSTPLKIDANGVAQNSVRHTTNDGKASMEILAGTTLLNSLGSPLAILTAQAGVSPPSAPSGQALIMAYNFGPAGATFNPSITVSMSYNPANLPADVVEANLYIAYYDGTDWVILESTVDPSTKTVSARVSHFSTFSLLGKIGQLSVPSPAPGASPSPTRQVTTTSAPPSIANYSIGKTPALTPSTTPPLKSIPPAQSGQAQPAPSSVKQATNNSIPWLIIILVVVIFTIGILISIRLKKPKTHE
jgi:hypothetical protein